MYICTYICMCLYICVLPPAQISFRKQAFLWAFHVQECCGTARHRVTDLVTKFPESCLHSLVWKFWSCWAFWDMWSWRQAAVQPALTSFPIFTCLKLLRWLYFMFIVIVLSSSYHNSIWLCTIPRISSVERPYFFYICFITTFPLFCMAFLKDFHSKPQWFTRILHINQLLFKRTSGILEMLQRLWSTDSSVHQRSPLPTMSAIPNMFYVT